MGVPLGTRGAGRTAAGARGRPDRGRGRAVGRTARVGRTAAACADCLDSPAAPSWPLAQPDEVRLAALSALTTLVLTNAALIAGSIPALVGETRLLGAMPHRG